MRCASWATWHAYERTQTDDTVAFGTKRDVYATGYKFAAHSLWPKVVPEEKRRIVIGGPDCKQPYSAALLNISAMSYGALSENAILALNTAAREGQFFHNTGEGGVATAPRRDTMVAPEGRGVGTQDRATHLPAARGHPGGTAHTCHTAGLGAGSGHCLVWRTPSPRGWGGRDKEKFVCLKSASNVRPL